MDQLIKKHAEKIRFGFVGVANTLIDFVALSIFVYIGFTVIIANIFSTSIALIFSFFANKNYTFQQGKSTPNKKRQFLTFLAITLFGLWGIQSLIMYLSDIILSPIIGQDYIKLYTGKIIATVTSLVWNYIMYRKYVFRGES